LNSRSKSLSEAFVNSFGSSPIGYCVGIIILPISAGWLKEDPIAATMMVTMVYATVSFVRVYFLRRFFEKFSYDDLGKLFLKLFRKMQVFYRFSVKPKQHQFNILGMEDEKK